MKERPILFSAPMVRAILDGRKTQTRRIINHQPPHGCLEIKEQPDTDPYIGCVVSGSSGIWEDVHSMDYRVRCPYGKPGDRLWVKETWFTAENLDGTKPTELQDDVRINYAADLRGEEVILGRLRPSLFMRRWMSRITLEIVSVSVARVQSISEGDAKAEGADREFEASAADFLLNEKWDHEKASTHKLGYKHLWESINGAGSWAANPWVWVVEFRRIEQ